jgi:hypothetical protein
MVSTGNPRSNLIHLLRKRKRPRYDICWRHASFPAPAPVHAAITSRCFTSSSPIIRRSTCKILRTVLDTPKHKQLPKVALPQYEFSCRHPQIVSLFAVSLARFPSPLVLWFWQEVLVLNKERNSPQPHENSSTQYWCRTFASALMLNMLSWSHTPVPTSSWYLPY